MYQHTKKNIFFYALFLLIAMTPSFVQAALESKFEVINFKPAVDSSEFVTIYDSQNLRQWQGSAGLFFDYAHKPLRFKGTEDISGSDSVIKALYVANVSLALGITDWAEIGINIPIVAYNDFITDDLDARPDGGGGMGDLSFITKFRLIDPSQRQFGISLLPYFTLPSGDVDRFTGNGHLTGGLIAIFDYLVNEKFRISLNLGAELRDDVTEHNVRIDDRFIYGLAAKYKFTPNWQAIAEIHGKTNITHSLNRSPESPLEATGSLRYLIGKSGVSVDFGGGVGIIDGVGTPQFRVFGGVKWVSAGVKECPECPPPAPPPDPRIRGDQIMIWGKIFFDTDKAEIKEMSLEVLDDVVEVMNSNEFIDLVEIQGHTDIRGADKYNLELSDKRANAVRDYLVSQGVDASRLVARGYGEDVPIATNDTKEGMSQNRRVEFHILRRSDFY